MRGMGEQITLVYRSGVFTKANYDNANNEGKVPRDFSRFVSKSLKSREIGMGNGYALESLLTLRVDWNLRGRVF